nr:MAG TPA_asm: hypothetical protein [Caudoviricetes sp.]
MDTIKINVNVQIGVTKELYSLLAAFQHNAVPADTAAPVENKPAEATKPVEVEQPKPEPEAEAKKEEAAPAAVPSPEPGAKQEEPARKEYTEVDVRASMEKTRKRIEGDDYKENTSGEKYKKYHRQLTAQFKNIAALLGSDKPSTLPSSELRESFCKQCDELVIGDDGNITTQAPPTKK